MNLMQLYRVAKMYYLDGMNQAEIGKIENLSRSQISRLLEQGRQQGIVRIEILLPDQLNEEKLSEFLAQEMGLESVYVATVDGSEVDERIAMTAIAGTAAAILPKEIRNCRTVGVGWGRTVYQASVWMPYSPYDTETLFVPLVGLSTTSDPHLQVNTIIDRFAQKQRGRSYFSSMHVFRERRIPLTARETQRIHSMHHYWNNLDAAIFGLGGKLNSSSYIAEEVGEDYLSKIENSSVLGDILSQFFFEDGSALDLREEFRQMAFDIQQLSHVPKTICLAGGPDKVDAIYAGARAGFFKTLVTDSVTARLLYEKIRRHMAQ
jgi:DNA-binding transcriptional regulator LsrR (DeoR family)